MTDCKLRRELIRSYENRIGKLEEQLKHGYSSVHYREAIEYCEEKIRDLKGERSEE